MRVIACYSVDTPYEKEAQLLSRSLDRVQMEYDVIGFPDGGDWYENTYRKACFIAEQREQQQGPLLYIDVDAFVHENCEAFFTMLADEGYDAGFYFMNFPLPGTRDPSPTGWRLLSGTIFLNDTAGARAICQNWRVLNDALRSCGLREGAGQKNLWFLLTTMKDLRIAQLPGRFCYVWARRDWYPADEPCILEHTIASRENRAGASVNDERRARIAELEGMV
jgi:hypothetical protein